MKRQALIIVGLFAFLYACGSIPLTYKSYYRERLSHFKRNKTKGAIIYMGDSITEGCGNQNNYPEFFIGDRVNRGIAGSQSKDMIQLANDVIIEEQPRIVQILVGINDVINEKGYSYARNMTTLIDTLRKGIPGVEIWLVSILPSTLGEQEELQKRNELLVRIADMYPFGVYFISYYEQFLLNGEVSKSLLPDGSHPVRSGCKIIFNKDYF